MAMYYYATKLSMVACVAGCRRPRRRRSHSATGNKHQPTQNDGDNVVENISSIRKVASTEIISILKSDTKVIAGKSSEMPEVPCEDTPVDFMNASMGTGGVMYHKGAVVSGPLESLIDLLLPERAEDYDADFTFAFLLSSRLFMRPHELLGTLLDMKADGEPLDDLVRLLKTWTRNFSYDFRDERMMSHIKHIASRCAETQLNETVSQLLCALLQRLTDLERHEQYLRACQHHGTEPAEDKINDNVQWPEVDMLAQVLCKMERKLAKHVGPEEFLQCSQYLLKDTKRDLDVPSCSKEAPGVQDPKKTCNLESYAEWSNRLKLLVAKEILKCPELKDRHSQLELWSGVAQFCLLVGNYNSATAILESLDSPPIIRLKETWSLLSVTTSQQLDCMQRQAEGCGNLWSQQNTTSTLSKSSGGKSGGGSGGGSSNSNNIGERVVIPVFVDIVRLALKVREDCLKRLPNGYINMTAFNKLAAIVGTFTRHIKDVSQSSDLGEHEQLGRYMQSCTLLTESELMLASFECEKPTGAEKELYDVT